MGAISPQYFALGVGSSGALVDVSAYVTGASDGVSRRYGQLDSFRDATPGTFTVVLDNYDGRFTPENTTAAVAAGYATTVTEGMAACLQIGSRLTAGQVIGVRPLLGSDWGRIQITCDDALGKLSRTSANSLAEGIASGSGAVATWLFDDPANSGQAAGYSVPLVSGPVAPFTTGGGVQFGVEGFPNGPATQVEFTAPAATSTTYQSVDGVARSGVGNYYRTVGSALSDSLLGVAFVITPMNVSSFFEIDTDWMRGFRIGIQNTNLVWYNPVSAAYETIMPITVNEPMSIWFGGSGGYAIYVNGVRKKTESGFVIATQQAPTITVGNASYGDTQVRFSTFVGGVEDPINLGGGTTITDRISSIATMGGVTITQQSGLWNALLGASSGASALEMLNDVIRTEQGYLYPVTTGTLTSNSEALNVRPRTRPTTVTASFDAVTELANAPEFIRDLTNTVSLTSVSGPDMSVAVADPTLIPRVGNKNDSDYTVLAEAGDLSLWGQDRLQRGGLVSLRLASLVIDAMTTPTDRSADLLALVPGDRVRVTNLPDDVLGFTEWDGWVVGGEETHNPTMNRFTFSLAPVLPPVPVFNDARYAAGTSLTLSSTINNSVTSISIATTDATFTTDSTDLPVNILIDSEEMTVTAVSSATPQVFTVTRGANGTTAASHASGAQVELATIEPTADATFVVNYATNPRFQLTANGLLAVIAGGGTYSYATVAASGNNTDMAGQITVSTSSSSQAVIYVNPLSADFVTGDTYYCAFLVSPSAPITASAALVTAQNADGTGTLSTTAGSSQALSAGVYTLLSVSGTVPASKLAARPAIVIPTSMTAGTTVRIDTVLLKKGTDAVSPFDGATASTSSLFFTWTGTTYVSTSYQATQGQVQPATFGF